MQQPDWLIRAWRELGVREVRGARDNPRIRAMFKDAGHPTVVRDEVAWCAAFLGACLERSGQRSTRSLMARSYLEWGVDAGDLKLGAIAVLSRGRDASLGHVGFVVGATAEHVMLLGGNQAQQVSVQAFARSRLLGVRWPAGAAPTEVPAPTPAAETDETGGDRRSMFAAALAHVLEMEGGFSDDPHDPGGPTNKGITLAVYATWVGVALTQASRARLVEQLKRIPDAMVREIYATRYWEPAGCEAMPPALALMHFDAAVNHGVGTAIRLLQRTVGTEADGEIGPRTRAALAATPLDRALRTYADLRRERYRALDHFWRFGKGWLRRVDATLARASRLLDEPPQGKIVRSEAGEEGAEEMEQGGKQVAKWWGESLTIWGVIVTGLSTVLPVVGPLIGLDVTADMIRLLGEQAVQVAQAVAGLVGTLMTIYGRARAKAPITRRPVSLRL